MLDPSRIDVVILCGGLGTRLRTGDAGAPKPMVLIQGKPFLQILVDYVASYGFRRFLFCVGYKADVIKEHFRITQGLQTEFSQESELLGTGGAVKHCEALLKSETILVMNGDSFCRIDLVSLLQFHQERGGVACLAVSPALGRTDGGVLTLGRDSQIVAFAEKPGSGNYDYFNAGVYAFERIVIEKIPAGKCSLELDILPVFLEKGIYGYVTDEPVYDIGTPERLERFREACGPKAKPVHTKVM